MALGTLALALLAAVHPAPTQAQNRGGEITVGLETDVRGFDTVKGGVLGQSGEIVMRTMVEPLISFDPKTGKFGPLLALSWEASKDQKVWTFKLRPGVKHHDGTAFDAEDVAHHYNRILDPKNKSRSRTFILTRTRQKPRSFKGLNEWISHCNSITYRKFPDSGKTEKTC